MKVLKSKKYDPNGDLSEGDMRWALNAGSAAFYRCKIKSTAIEYNGCSTLVLGQIGNKKYLVYVRVTDNKDEEDGTGKMPLILIDAALEFKAEPVLVRLNLDRNTKLGGIFFDSCGVDELEEKIKSNVDEWNRVLLKDKTINDYLKLKGMRVSTLQMDVSVNNYIPKDMFEEYRWAQKLNKKDDDPLTAANWLSIDLKADNKNIIKPYCLDIINLLKTLKGSDEYYVLNCDCGEPGCAGINRGVLIVMDAEYVLWKIYTPKLIKLLIFDRIQYKNEIISGIKIFISEYHSKSCIENNDVFLYNIKQLEKTVYDLDL